MTDIDTEIDQQHAAAQAAEDRAVAVIERMRRITGLATVVDKMPRRFGQPPNPYAAGSRNLTAAGLLERHDPALAQHLATLAGTSINAPNYAAKAEAEERVAAAERMRQETERLAAENELRRRARDRAAMAGVSMLTGRRLGQ
jgi:nucleotide-binding universal stress UspA family protein